ncbi:hypothetical protein ILUMI_11157, partial [Ignelater luminosus]
MYCTVIDQLSPIEPDAILVEEEYESSTVEIGCPLTHHSITGQYGSFKLKELYGYVTGEEKEPKKTDTDNWKKWKKKDYIAVELIVSRIDE